MTNPDPVFEQIPATQLGGLSEEILSVTGEPTASVDNTFGLIVSACAIGNVTVDRIRIRLRHPDGHRQVLNEADALAYGQNPVMMLGTGDTVSDIRAVGGIYQIEGGPGLYQVEAELIPTTKYNDWFTPRSTRMSTPIRVKSVRGMP